MQRSALVQERTADDKRVGEMEAGHSCQLIDIAASYPDRFGVVLSNGVAEAERFWKESRRHAGVEGEDHEGGEVAESHCSADEGEDVVGRRVEVPPG